MQLKTTLQDYIGVLIKICCPGNVNSAEEYIHSFKKTFAVNMHCVLKHAEGARFKAEIKKYTRLVKYALELFE